MRPARASALILVGALVVGCANPTATSGPPSSPAASHPASSARPSSAPASPTPTPSPTPRALRPGEDDWGPVPSTSGLRDRYGSSTMVAVAAGPRSIVAVGESPTGAAVWRSVDGLTWQRAEPDATWRYATLGDVAATPAGYVAVGSIRTGDTAWQGAAWTSGDGLHWTLGARAGGVDLTRVAAGADATYALGTRESEEEEGASASSVWRSRNGGRTWEQLADPQLTEVRAIAVGTSGVVIVAGSMGYEAAFARTDDGATWTTVTVPSAYPFGVSDLAWADGRWVAVGSGPSTSGTETESGSPASPAWVSLDGRSWTQAPASEAFHRGDADVALAAVTSTSDGRWVALDVTNADPSIMFSDDGHAWSARVSLPAGGVGGSAWDLAAVGDRLVVVGVSYGDAGAPLWEEEAAAVWVNPAPPAPPPAPTPLPSPAPCPGRRPDLLRLIELLEDGRGPDCYGTGPLTIRAFVTPWDLEYGERVPPEPAWLIWPYWAALPVDGRPGFTMTLGLHVRPGSDVQKRLRTSAPGRWLWITGHFGDAAAKLCPAEFRESCRRAFVVDRVRPAEAP